MSVRVGINGCGRVGRAVLRRMIEQQPKALELAAVNDITASATIAHLLRFDSTYGEWPKTVISGRDRIEVDGQQIMVTAAREPETLDWRAAGVELVIEATGRFRSRDAAAGHLRSGARKVLISAPGRGVDATIVLGVNEDTYQPGHHDVISNASCTTNCVAPMVDVLHRNFGVRRGFMTTIHGYTNDQVLLDSPHSDLRRARSGAVNLIPTSTGAARAIGQVIPELAGRLDGVAIRVPVENGSLVDLTVEVDQPVTAEEVNLTFQDAAADRLHGILRYRVEPIVSRDVIGDPASCVFDSALTQADQRLVKVFGWYDNEWGYASRLLDLAEYVANRM